MLRKTVFELVKDRLLKANRRSFGNALIIRELSADK